MSDETQDPQDDTPEVTAEDAVAANPEADSRQRLKRAFLHPGPGQTVVALLLAVLGTMAVTQVRLAGTDDDFAGMRQADLIQALQGLQATSRRTEQDIAELERTRDALRSNNDKTAAALEQARTELDTLGILGGTVPARGPGVRITVTVPEGRISLNYLLDGIEELRDAGAEAMEINDAVRIVASTSFESLADGGGINVDGRVLESPFTIDAIGDPDSLDKALNFAGGFVDDVALDEGEVAIEQSQDIEVSVIRRATRPQYADPAD